MRQFQYSRSDDGTEVRTDFGSLLAGLDEQSRTILWQALTIDVLGNHLMGNDDVLHVMFDIFGRRDDLQYRAQVDRLRHDGQHVDHLFAWHGTLEEGGMPISLVPAELPGSRTSTRSWR